MLQKGASRVENDFWVGAGSLLGRKRTCRFYASILDELQDELGDEFPEEYAGEYSSEDNFQSHFYN